MVRIGVMPGQWGWPFAALRDAWRAADASGFDVVGCFDHVTAAPRGVPAWDAPSLLTAMAAHVSTARLALWVVNVSLRHPLLLAGQLAVAQAASGGRIEVGLGAGSMSLARFDHAALGLDFPPLPQRMARLEAVCRVLPALWSGASVTEPSLGLHDASLGEIGIAQPPLLIGGRSQAALEIAARHASAWNAEEGDPGQYAQLADRAAQVARDVGRREPFPGTVQVFVQKPDAAELRELVDGYAAAGASTVMFLLDEPDPALVERIGEAVR